MGITDKLQIFDVIKYEGPTDVFAWKFPGEDFNTHSKLIVNESQEAILFRNGQALDTFTAGRYVLTLDNIPLLSKMQNLFNKGRETQLTSQVYYVNKTIPLNLKWGTDSPIQVYDPFAETIVNVRANGRFGVQVEDSRKMLIKLVGTMTQFDQQTLRDYFIGLMMSEIKSEIGRYITEKQISVLQISMFLAELSETLKRAMSEQFLEYGIRLDNCYVNSVNVPAEDLAKIKAAQDEAKARKVQGYTYQEEKQFEVLGGAARNTGSAGAMMGMGLGLGMGAGMGVPFGAAMGGIAQNAFAQSAPQAPAPAPAQQAPAAGGNPCPGCGYMVPDSFKFCPKCGHAAAPPPVKEADSFCPNCGKQIPAGSKFCPGCGRPVV